MATEGEWRTWDLRGLQVTQLRFDFQFHIFTWSLERELIITFGLPFTYRSPDGNIQTFNPEQNESLGKLLSLLHRDLTTFAASSEGECMLTFEDGSELLAEPHQQYESWESHGNGQLQDASLLCAVGGGPPWR
jgi:hypothetical protein